MVTRPTNHITSARDHSHNLLTWFQHVIYELYPDIKSSLIPTSALPFILTSSHHQFQYSHHDYILVSFITAERVFNKSKNLAWALSKVLGGLQRKTTFRLTPYPDSSSGTVEEVSLITINESYWWEPQWVVSRTASWTQHKPESRGR